MTRRLAGLVALVALPFPGCDAVDFPLLTEPAPEPGVAAIQVRYAHGDSLRGNLAVFLRSWLAPGSNAEVLLDGRPVPRVQAPAPDASFQDAWTLAPAAFGSLPQTVAIPGLAEEIMLIPLPVLVREGSAVVCVGDQDPILRYSEIALPQSAPSSWRVQLGGNGGLVIQGQGLPPEPLRLPRELLGGMAEPRTVELHVSVHTHTELEEAILVLSAALLVDWTLIAGEAGDPPCPESA